MSDHQNLFDEFLDPVIITTEEKDLIYANNAFLILFQTTLRKLKKNTVEKFCTFEDSRVFLNSGQSINDNNINTQLETKFKTIENIEGTVLVITKKLSDGLVLTFLRDMALEVNLHSKYHSELAENEKLIDQLKLAKKKLEIYNKNLEKIVEQRTAELKKANQYLKTMANSIGQALLMFDKDGNCLPIYTKTVINFFGKDPSGRSITEVLPLDNKEQKTFLDWCQITFQGMIPFKDTLNLSLKEIVIKNEQNNEKRIINLEYFPVKNSKGSLANIVLVGTDITEEVQSKKELENQNSYVKMILKIIENKDSFVNSLKEARQFLDQAFDLLHSLNEKEPRNDILRHLHSVKGICSLYEVSDITKYIHNLEVSINKAQETFEYAFPPDLKNDFVNKIKYTKEILLKFCEEMSPIVGDAILTNSPMKEVRKQDIEDFYASLCEINPEQAKKFQQQFKSVPLNYYFKGYELLLSSLAKKLGKKIKPFQIIGGEISIPDDKYKDVFNIFIHLFRNSIDHGIEYPDERIQLGKDPEGQISLEASHLKNTFTINISDDGSGVDINKLKQSAKKQGISTDKMSREDILKLIFNPKLTTIDEATEVSGQGIGMSAVEEVIKRNNGKIDVYSSPRNGTTFTIELDL